MDPLNREIFDLNDTLSLVLQNDYYSLLESKLAPIVVFRELGILVRDHPRLTRGTC
jgi:hypothetical protein